MCVCVEQVRARGLGATRGNEKVVRLHDCGEKLVRLQDIRHIMGFKCSSTCTVHLFPRLLLAQQDSMTALEGLKKIDDALNQIIEEAKK